MLDKEKSAGILGGLRAFLTQYGANTRAFQAIYHCGAPPLGGCFLCFLIEVSSSKNILLPVRQVCGINEMFYFCVGIMLGKKLFLKLLHILISSRRRSFLLLRDSFGFPCGHEDKE